MPGDPSGFLGEPPPPWRVIAERKIQAWVDAGGPDRLTNRGQKLDLTANPFVPVELRIAFDVLKNADAAPPWVAIGHEGRLDPWEGLPDALDGVRLPVSTGEAEVRLPRRRVVVVGSLPERRQFAPGAHVQVDQLGRRPHVDVNAGEAGERADRAE